MPTARADAGRQIWLPPTATLMDQIAPILSNRPRKKPHLGLVVASIVTAIGLWFVIYAVSGRVIWFW